MCNGSKEMNISNISAWYCTKSKVDGSNLQSNMYLLLRFTQTLIRSQIQLFFLMPSDRNPINQLAPLLFCFSLSSQIHKNFHLRKQAEKQREKVKERGSH